MGMTTNIQWTDRTWNIARGCTKVDEDCKYCYMYRDSYNATRYNPRQVIRTKTVFTLPLRVKEPSKIFTSSLTDVFHEAIDSYRAEVWEIIRACPQHTFQILTKRPERILECLPDDWGEGWPNVWMGTSIGHQGAMHRLYELLKVPAAIRFVSFEPLWQHIDMNLDIRDLLKIDWAIIGGESGHDTGSYRYRPCQVEWMQEICDAVRGVGNYVFVKQMGTYLSKQRGMRTRHGDRIAEFPKSLQVREFPKVAVLQ